MLENTLPVPTHKYKAASELHFPIQTLSSPKYFPPRKPTLMFIVEPTRPAGLALFLLSVGAEAICLLHTKRYIHPHKDPRIYSLPWTCHMFQSLSLLGPEPFAYYKLKDIFILAKMYSEYGLEQLKAISATLVLL